MIEGTFLTEGVLEDLRRSDSDACSFVLGECWGLGGSATWNVTQASGGTAQPALCWVGGVWSGVVWRSMRFGP